MRVSAACVVLPLAVQAANLVLSNDDGWAELNIRTFYNALKTAGENVIVSAPAQDKSGSGRPCALSLRKHQRY
jgi:5'/3'-nucleotidase SurE